MDTKMVRDELWLLSSLLKWSFLYHGRCGRRTVAAGFLISLDWAVEYVSSLNSWRYLLIFPRCSSVFIL